MRDALSDTLDALADDDDVRCVVLTGAGPVFCAGFDLREFELANDDPAFAEALWSSSDRYHRRVLTLVPIIAAVNGPAIAGGFDLAVMCDVRIAEVSAVFAHPERTFGPVVYGPLHDLVGGALARDLCLTGRVLGAPPARRDSLATCSLATRLLDAAMEIAAATAEALRALLADTKAKAMRLAGVDPDGSTLTL
ncbi:MAG: enoyl-CoA hydratase/isomerase family protein [Acidimicrobiales bacterium]